MSKTYKGSHEKIVKKWLYPSLFFLLALFLLSSNAQTNTTTPADTTNSTAGVNCTDGSNSSECNGTTPANATDLNATAANATNATDEIEDPFLCSGEDDTPYCLQLFYASNGGFCCLKLVFNNGTESFYCGEDPSWYNPFYNTSLWI